MVEPQHYKWIYLPMETKSRDFHGRVLFSCFAALHGFRTVLCHKSAIGAVLSEFPCGIYFHYGFLKNYQKTIDLAKHLGHYTAAWDEEGLVYFEKDYLDNRISSEVMTNLDCIITWGKAQSTLIKQSMGETEKCIEAGHPRFDLLRKEYRDLYQTRASEYRNRWGDYILVNTNFVANHYYGKDADFLRLKSIGYFKDSEREQFYSEKIEFNQRTIQYFIDAIRKISISFPEYNIIVRPHPSERPDTWQSWFKDSRNVHVIYEDSVLCWIMGSLVIIHIGCTTGIEAFLLDKNTISYHPELDKRFDVALPNRLSIEIDNEELLLNTLREILKGKGSYRTEWQVNLLKNHYASLEGPSASERIIKNILRLPFSEAERGRYAFLRYKLKEHMRRWKRKYRRTSSREDDANYIQHKFPGMSKSELEDIIMNLSHLDNRFKGIRCQEIGKNTFIISPGEKNIK